MAYLGNTLINGSLRCLNKAYFNDLSIGSDVEIAGKTTTNQLVVSAENLGNLVTTNSSTGTIPVIIGNPTGVHIAMDADEIQFKNNATSNRAGYINYGGGRIYLSNGTKIYADNGVFKADSLGTSDSRIPTTYITTLDVTTGNITTLKTSTAHAENLTVYDTLKSSKWDISSVANLANDFMVAPTIKISSDGEVTISNLSTTDTTSKTCRLTFSDGTQINSDEFAGCRWYAGSKVRVTFTINGTLNSNIEGTLAYNMNPTAGTLTIDVTLDDRTNLSNKTYEADDSTIMLYEIASGSNLYPVGIRMTAYGTNNSSYIDMYGGTASTDYTHPIVRIGRLNGITFNGKTFGTNELPAAWGIYTLNGYFEGAIVANEGKIGEWIIDSKKIYTGTWGSNNSAMMSPGTTSTDGNKSIGGSNPISGWTFTSGANFGVNKDGSLYANKGKIGGWNIGSNAITNGTWGTADSAMVCTGSSTAKAIGGSDSISGWTFTSGANFGVTKTGALYASDVNISGAINATALHVGSSSSTNHLIYENNTIDIQTDWLKFDSSTNTVIIGKDNAPRVNIDGQSMYLKDMNNDTYFIVGDKRTNEYYEFTVSNPDIVEGSSSYIETSCDIDENYPVVVMDEDGNDIGYTSITHVTVSGKPVSRIAGDYHTFQDTFKIAYTTSTGVYGIQFGYASSILSSIGAFSSCFSGSGTSSGAYSFAEGKHTVSSGYASHAEGGGSESRGIRSHAEGSWTLSSGKVSHAEGWRSVASGSSSHAEGYISTASNFGSHAEGYITVSSGQWGSHAEGSGTTASNNASHAEGWQTTASGKYSHSEGYKSSSENTASHTEGYQTTASGNYGSHAEGYYTTASGNGSHAEGYYTTASASYSHTEGYQTTASGNFGSHAEGYYTTALTSYSHAEGYQTTASGNYGSHAEGNRTTASGNYSHAGGIYTYATKDSQTAIGKYNATTKVYSDVLCSDSLVCSDDLVVDGTTYTHDAGDYAFIIGNGISDSKRSNALTVDWNGDILAHQYIVQYPDTTIGTHPSSDYYNYCVAMRDSTGGDFARLLSTHTADGRAGFTIEAVRTVNSSTVWNSLRLFIDDNGTKTVQVTDPAAWRIALGVNIKTYDVTLTTNAYGELSIPDAISSKTILTARTLAYNYGVLLTSRLRVYEVSGNSPVLAKNTSVPFRFVYIQ